MMVTILQRLPAEVALALQEVGGGTSWVEQAIELVPLLSIVAIVVGLGQQSRSHGLEIERLLKAEDSKRGSQRREMILDLMEPLLESIEAADRAIHELTYFVAEVGGFHVHTPPEPGYEEDHWLARHLGAMKEATEEEVAAAQVPAVDRLRKQHGDQLVLGDYVAKRKDGLPLTLYQEHHSRTHHRLSQDVAGINEHLRTLGELESELAGAIRRSKIFRFDDLHTHLSDMAGYVLNMPMPVRIAIGTLDGTMSSTGTPVNLHLVDRWLFGYAYDFRVASHAVVDDLRSLLGEEPSI